MARKPITVRLNDEEAELLEQAARMSGPAFQAAVRHAVKANQRVFERLAQT